MARACRARRSSARSTGAYSGLAPNMLISTRFIVGIALAWLLQKQPVTAPLVGATKISHLEVAIGALSITLPQREFAYLEAPYTLHPIVGHE